MASNRWDRSLLKKLSKAQRLEVERRLVKGESGLSISKAMGFPKSMYVSAVKKNPIPGGVLDPKGKLASYEGVWVDPDYLVRPYVGLKDGKPIVREPLDPKRSQWKKGQSGNPPAGREIPGSKDPALPAKKELGTPESPETGKGDPTNAQPPDAHHESSRPVEDLGTPLPPSDKMTKKRGKGNRTLKEARKFSKRYLPLEERIKLLAKLAKDVDEPQVALRAITILNDLDGLVAAAKEPSAANLGGGPLFQLPRDMNISFAPVGRESIPANSEILESLQDPQESTKGEDEEPTPQG